MAYQPGDHLSIFPNNDEVIVNGVLDRIMCPVDVDVPVHMEHLKGDY